MIIIISILCYDQCKMINKIYIYTFLYIYTYIKIFLFYKYFMYLDLIFYIHLSLFIHTFITYLKCYIIHHYKYITFLFLNKHFYLKYFWIYYYLLDKLLYKNITIICHLIFIFCCLIIYIVLV